MSNHNPRKLHPTPSMESRKAICFPTSSMDRLTNLPEPLLHHILSFLPIREVIQTSLFSEKWKYLWTSIPFLQFSDTDWRSVKDFTKFVRRVLALRQTPTIFTFNLNHTDSFCDPIHDIFPWTLVAVNSKVCILDPLFLPHFWIKTVHFPESLFTCQSLTQLTLKLGDYLNESCFVVPIPGLSYLPALKYLFLGSIRNLNTVFLDKFFAGCRVLEILVISCCEFDEFNRITIAAVQLKHLVIEYFETARVENFPPGYPSRGCTDRCRIVVATPNLISFTSMDYALHDYSFENLSCLDDDEIGKEISKEFMFDPKVRGDNPVLTRTFTLEDSNSMIKELKELSTVRSLTLNFGFLKAVSVVGAEVLKRLITPYTNLRILQLSTLMMDDQVRAIIFLLHNCSNINTLVIRMISAEETSVNIAQCWGKEFLLKNLKHIEVQYIEGSSDEVEFLKVLLRIAVTLRKMTIFASKRLSANGNRSDAFSDELSTCERTSSNMEIVIRKS